ncbi:MAG TPA: GNAT family N-acetyltransferase [Micromonosporaceae bacterium]
MHIRQTTIDDVPAIDEIWGAAHAWHTITVEAQRTLFTSDPPEARQLRLCAEVGDRLVGSGVAMLNLYAGDNTTAIVSLLVAPDTRGGGTGSALYERLEVHLRRVGATRIQAEVDDEPVSLSFAGARGFELGATDLYVVVDPRDLPPMPDSRSGVAIRTVRESGPEPIYQVINTAAKDEPGDVPFEGIPYEDWIAQYWPSIDHDLSMVAFVDGAPAASTALRARYELGRASSAGSDCLPEFRGRGLVKLLKSRSLRAAADRGITAAYTSNDETNAPMRAINAWLGYRPVGSTRSALKQL